ncbi:hypothetical protein LX36DRAFT_239119 [Colletotrichum falcatum]|nr:hypothetical protein LX36DRAFT_239119 [Colletotrichum falcatum]
MTLGCSSWVVNKGSAWLWSPPSTRTNSRTVSCFTMFTLCISSCLNPMQRLPWHVFIVTPATVVGTRISSMVWIESNL